MPVLKRSEDESTYFALVESRGESEVYDLSIEGQRFLTGVLGIHGGDEFPGRDLQFLVDRGWATLRPTPEPEPEPEPVAPVVEIRPEPVVERPKKPAGVNRPSVNRRTRAREVALQVLYQLDLNPGEPADHTAFLQRRLRDDRLRNFAESLVEGVHAHRPKLDELISGVAENWRIDRMAAIDRNILRLGAFEMLFCPDVPVKVAINEALELAKRYSTAQSSRFVNGILDRLQGADPSEAPVPPPDPEPPGVANDSGLPA